MNILVVVHLEPDFGEHLFELAEEVISYSEDFDRVINITSAEALTGTEPFWNIKEAFYDNREWIWGFDAEENVKEDPERWIEGENWIRSNGHEFSEILDWMHELSKNDKYTIVGGCRTECLQDIVDIFDHLELENEVEESLTF